MKSKPRNTKPIATEHAEQVAFVKWFRLQFPKVMIFAIPNGGLRNVQTARKLKAEGVLSGVSDLYVPMWKLWIEIKRTKSWHLSEAQESFRDYVTNCGDSWLLAIGADHGRELLLSMKRDMKQWWLE